MSNLTLHIPSEKGSNEIARFAGKIGEIIEEFSISAVDSKAKSMTITKLEEAFQWGANALATTNSEEVLKPEKPVKGRKEK